MKCYTLLQAMRVVYSDVRDSGYGGSSVCTGLPECSTHFEGGLCSKNLELYAIALKKYAYLMEDLVTTEISLHV